jgi:hypothetical protein
VEKYSRAGQATDDSTVQALCTLGNFVYRHGNYGYENVPKFYFIRTLPVFYNMLSKPTRAVSGKDDTYADVCFRRQGKEVALSSQEQF